MSQRETATDVVTFLTIQHDQIRDLFVQTRQSDPKARADTFQCLVRLLAVHETAEEELVHPAVRRAEGGDDIVQARLAEESDAKEALADLERMDPTTVEFLEELATLERAVLAHAQREEGEEFPILRAAKDDDDLRQMASRVQTAEAMAPTHPHPHGPDSAVGNLLVGPFVAMADRVRDALHDRRKHDG